MFIRSFLNTYREVADTPQVLDLQFTRFSNCEAPTGPSGQTDTLANSWEDVIPRNQLCHAITCLLGSWLDLHPEDFLVPAQLPCLQRLLTHLRLHMLDSDIERHVSHVLAQLGIKTHSQGEATGAEPGPETQPVQGPGGAKAPCVEEEPASMSALEPSPEGARAARGGAESPASLISALSAQGAAAAGAQLEPHYTMPNVEETAVSAEEMEPRDSLAPVLGPQRAAEAVAGEEPVSISAPGPDQATFSADPQMLLYLAELLYLIGAPAVLLSLVTIVIVLLCVVRELTSNPLEGSDDGAPPRSTDSEPCATSAAGLTPREASFRAEPEMFVTLGVASIGELDVLVTLTLLLYFTGAPPLLLFLIAMPVVGVQTPPAPNAEMEAPCGSAPLLHPERAPGTGVVAEGSAQPLPGLHLVPEAQQVEEHLAPTIRAIVAHVNNVCSCTITPCVEFLSMKAPDRARVVAPRIQEAMMAAILCLDRTWQEIRRWAPNSSGDALGPNRAAIAHFKLWPTSLGHSHCQYKTEPELGHGTVLGLCETIRWKKKAARAERCLQKARKKAGCCPRTWTGLAWPERPAPYLVPFPSALLIMGPQIGGQRALLVQAGKLKHYLLHPGTLLLMTLALVFFSYGILTPSRQAQGGLGAESRVAAVHGEQEQSRASSRMVYPQPMALTPARRDVLVLTPWLAPIIWEGTFNTDILNEQFRLQNITVGLSVFAIKNFGTLHPGFYTSKRDAFTYERRPQSQAYIPHDQGDFYYMGAFFGGSVAEVHRLTKACHEAMVVDRANNIEAVWHDESHLNKYLLLRKPTKVLSLEYLWDLHMLPWPSVLKKLRFVAVHKNHQEIRNR
ncbi:PREDICTED: uncharacterized protein LOC105989338 [Dipodomys ordii]|uniref:Uncharacterized protein LOC105989338 n=1 Tax=Dipodomys ordii TaxID=10020 RepID=A0A1S3FKA0_DIPOR|nr:PREDICTED: uncharacterized protein LOC105989338 [Dipodomys ordii]